MPVYEYQGVSYELATDDPAVAKQRILSYLEQSKETPAQQFGRGAASLADSALNAVTGTLDYLAYPFARTVNTAEQAQKATTSDKDIIGRMFGVTGTPSYEGAPLRRLGTAIGETVQEKIVDPAATATGVAPQDISSLLGTATLAAGPGALRATTAAGRGVQAGTAATADAVRQVGRGIVSASKPEPQASAPISPATVQQMRASGAIGPATEAAIGYKDMRVPIPGRVIESAIEDVIRGYNSPTRGLASGAIDLAGLALGPELFGFGIPIATAGRLLGTGATRLASKVKPVQGTPELAIAPGGGLYGASSGVMPSTPVRGDIAFDVGTGAYSPVGRVTPAAAAETTATTLQQMYDNIRNTQPELSTTAQRDVMISSNVRNIKQRLRDQNLDISNGEARKQSTTEVDTFLKDIKDREFETRRQAREAEAEKQRQEYESSPEGQAFARRQSILNDAAAQDAAFARYLNEGGIGGNKRQRALTSDQDLEAVMMEYQQRQTRPQEPAASGQDILAMIRARQQPAGPEPVMPNPPTAAAEIPAAPAAPAAPTVAKTAPGAITDRLQQIRQQLQQRQALKTPDEVAKEATEIDEQFRQSSIRGIPQAAFRRSKQTAQEAVKSAVSRSGNRTQVNVDLIEQNLGRSIDRTALPDVSGLSVKQARDQLSAAVQQQIKADIRSEIETQRMGGGPDVISMMTDEDGKRLTVMTLEGYRPIEGTLQSARQATEALLQSKLPEDVTLSSTVRSRVFKKITDQPGGFDAVRGDGTTIQVREINGQVYSRTKP